jgi:hypothetical protein
MSPLLAAFRLSMAESEAEGMPRLRVLFKQAPRSDSTKEDDGHREHKSC